MNDDVRRHTTDTVELTVSGFANGGAGVARRDGRVVFVGGALPGETVSAVITDDKGRFARAETVTVLEPSEHRVDPLCAAAAAGAGCCDLAYADPDYARTLKAGALTDVLTRIGKLPAGDIGDVTLTALGDRATGWRIRARLAVGPDGVPGQRAAGSSRIVTEPCAAPEAGLLDGLAGLGAAPGSELVVVAGDDRVRHVGELTVPAPPKRPRGRGDKRRSRAQQRRSRAERPSSLRMLEGPDLVAYRVGARTWELPATAFWQAHRRAPAAFSETVARMARAGAVEVGWPGDRGLRVWDLYGGAGVLGAGLLDAGLPVAHIDLVDTAADALRAADRTLAGDPVTTHRGPVTRQAPALARPDVVIADPPRSGAGIAVVDAIAEADPGVIVHVGCDAAAFARDLGRYLFHGYRIGEIRGFDAFPLTSHLEAIALLHR